MNSPMKLILLGMLLAPSLVKACDEPDPDSCDVSLAGLCSNAAVSDILRQTCPRLCNLCTSTTTSPIPACDGVPDPPVNFIFVRIEDDM